MSHKEIYLRCKSKDFQPKHVAEVGVYKPRDSNIIDFIEHNTRATLVEPDPNCVKAIKEYFHDRDQVNLYPVAVYDRNGTIELVNRDASTFVRSLSRSPALVNDKYKVRDEDAFEVEARIFSDIDDGTIDLLSVDVEGSEWYVIKHLVSTPKVISVETHGKYYLNPFLKEIMNWMREHQYILWYKNNSDSVYIREGAFPITMWEKIWLRLKETHLQLRRLKRWIRP